MDLIKIAIPLSLLLLLQLLYCILGIGFNGVSYLRTQLVREAREQRCAGADNEMIN